MFALGPSERSAGAIARPLAERATAAGYAAMAYWFYWWDWGEAIAFDGLDAWSRASGQPDFARYVDRTLDAWIERTTGRPSRFGPGSCLVSRYEATGEKRYLDFARRVGDVLLDAPLHDGAVLLDHPSKSIFVDTLAEDPPFLLGLARVTGDERYARRADEIMRGHCELLQNKETGLFGHFVDRANNVAPGIHWGRGNGWAGIGLAKYLVRGEGAPAFDEVKERFDFLLRGLETCRIAGAGWRNLIDRQESYPESSTTVMIAYAIDAAVAAGVADPRWQRMADEAWASVEHRLNVSGQLIGVSYRPGVNTDPSRYEHAPALEGAYPWAQGPYLLAAAGRYAPTE